MNRHENRTTYYRKTPSDEIIVRHISEGLTCAQIGALYGVDGDAVMRQIQRKSLRARAAQTPVSVQPEANEDIRRKRPLDAPNKVVKEIVRFHDLSANTRTYWVSVPRVSILEDAR